MAPVQRPGCQYAERLDKRGQCPAIVPALLGSPGAVPPGARCCGPYDPASDRLAVAPVCRAGRHRGPDRDLRHRHFHRIAGSGRPAAAGTARSAPRRSCRLEARRHRLAAGVGRGQREVAPQRGAAVAAGDRGHPQGLHPASATAHRLPDGVPAIPCSARLPVRLRGQRNRAPGHEAAGIDGEGLPAAYVFRHSRATHLLRGGAAPEAVGALLRHQSLKTTALYARVDAPMLLAVAQPWPGEPR